MNKQSCRVGCAAHRLEVPLFAELAGYGPFLGRRNLGERDPLFCRVLSISDSASRNLIIVSDVLTTNDQECRLMRQRLAERFGIRPDGILFLATHTHSAPLIGPSDVGYGEVSTEFVEIWRKTVSETVQAAIHNEEEVSVFTGSAKIRKPIGQNRIESQPGQTDPSIRWMKIIRADGTVKALLHNHSMHGIVFGAQRMVSGDWMGDVNRKIIQRGLAEIPFFLYGCAGDINVLWTYPWPNSNPVECDKNLDWISENYVDDLEADLNNSTEIVLGPVQAALETVEFPTEPVSSEDYRIVAKKLLAKLPSEHGKLLQYIHDRMLEMAAMADRGYDFRVFHDLQVLRMGDFSLFAVPGEPFLSLGEALMQRASSPFAMAVSLANGGDAEYLPPPELFQQYPDPFCCDDFGAFGFYEVWFGPGQLRAKFKPDIVPVVINKLLALQPK